MTQFHIFQCIKNVNTIDFKAIENFIKQLDEIV
jgi:hypothetical protein